MNTLPVSRPAGLLAAILLAAACPLAADAAPKSAPQPRPELILSMPSDQWLDEQPPQSGPTLADNREQNLIGTGKNRKSKVDVACNMDLNQNTVGEAPLSERLGGNCEFGYRY
ncbi:hypothetical protein NP603_10140 [Methylomonas sp. SURF-1]|uniref:Uncharacterized protein n=1 Tax=Methylomonas aurea TaxID=2952224 RepID=A0ABT1UH63_9GAMM|nr:hypothetical protein [Methylomonas sp. SURF-1]MCQ8181467.1 hypothetical protein [Methylomonas sp. SURF-1]